MLTLNPDKTDVLLANFKSDQGIGIQSLLDKVTFSEKSGLFFRYVCSWIYT